MPAIRTLGAYAGFSLLLGAMTAAGESSGPQPHKPVDGGRAAAAAEPIAERLIRFPGLPRERMTMVPGNQRSFRLTVRYSNAIVQGSLNVRLNNQDITDRFLVERAEQVVELPLRVGDNRIDFWATRLVNGSEESEAHSIYVYRPAAASAIGSGALPVVQPPRQK